MFFKEMLKSGYKKISAVFTDNFGFGPGATAGAIAFSVLVVMFAVFWFIHSAPPGTLVITTGVGDSRLQKTAQRYAQILERNGVKLQILPSEGSLENLKRLKNPSFRVDVGFVQSGLAKGENVDGLMSLGSIAYEPLYLFYRGNKDLEFLSGFKGKSLSIGEEGTGTKFLALELLSMNGITKGGETKLLEMDDENSFKLLIEGKIDAVVHDG